MCDNRTNLSKLLTQQVEEMYQEKIKVFQTKIPKTVKVGEAIYSGQSIKKYAKGSSVDIGYASIGDVIVVAVKDAIPTSAIKKGSIEKTIIIRIAKEYRRSDSTYIRFNGQPW